MENKSEPTLSQFPTSFQVEKYDACANFEAQDWYVNLMHRALRKSAATHGDYYARELKRAANMVLENPIFPRMNLVEGDGFSKNVFKSQIRDQTAYDYLSGEWILRVYGNGDSSYGDALTILDKDVHVEAKFDEKATQAYEKLDVPAWKMLTDLGVDISGEVFVSVDLYASEEKLIDDFRIWLRATRSALGAPNIKRRFSGTDFERWHQNRILGYLDLTFWAQINGFRLTNEVIGSALFPNEYNVSLSERVRKVVAPLALSASSSPFIEALLSQELG
ncbi:hypothetical protein G3O06_10350 [Burkholderia sp. Ac-20345]|uniref:DUF6387 family protein n=1 Tax=Burkholderia sp. Ac-20345 TaxID=2703891 RepID=UPI00197BFE7F|nr:DUF6387 family protein [Burkholderia sp. Ac-20345]MBN3777953.1 hypothetical protein [Burkholderia sp. Ac-20345]